MHVLKKVLAYTKDKLSSSSSPKVAPSSKEGSDESEDDSVVALRSDLKKLDIDYSLLQDQIDNLSNPEVVT